MDLDRTQLLAWAVKMQLDNSANGALLKRVAAGQQQMPATQVRTTFIALVGAAQGGVVGTITPAEQFDLLGNAKAAYSAINMQPSSVVLARQVALGIIQRNEATYVGDYTPPAPPPPILIDDDGVPLPDQPDLNLVEAQPEPEPDPEA